MKRISAFSDLAELYFPECATAGNAMRCLNRNIKKCAPLMEELEETCFAPRSHRYLTPKQYYIIVRHLGDPFHE